jgi:excisionase family DNA binding protein
MAMIDVHGAAKRLGLSKWAIWRLVRAGELPCYQYWERGGYRFDTDELDAWEEERRWTAPRKRRKRTQART